MNATTERGKIIFTGIADLCRRLKALDAEEDTRLAEEHERAVRQSADEWRRDEAMFDRW